MNDVSLFRLYVLRALYLLIAVGLGIMVWPDVIVRDQPWPLMGGVVKCMLASFGALALLGVRYPLQMLPILFWELVWKLLWLSIVAYPAWSAGQMDQRTMSVAIDCLLVVLLPIAMPWSYVVANYIRKPAARWRAGAAALG